MLEMAYEGGRSVDVEAVKPMQSEQEAEEVIAQQNDDGVPKEIAR